jgi:hypothetical protein
VHNVGERLFPIQSQGYDFFTGICADGRQVVMGLLCPELVAYFFDAHGSLVGAQRRTWSDAAADVAGRVPPYRIFNDEFKALIGLQRREWEGELGFRTATIHVKEFFDHELGVGIELLPAYLREIETAPWFRDTQERERAAKLRNRWVEDGNFVWYWAKDYYMSPTGEVEST